MAEPGGIGRICNALAQMVEEKGGDARDAKTESAARRLGLREAGTAAIIADRLRRVRQSRGLSPSGGGQTTCVTEQRTTSLT